MDARENCGGVEIVDGCGTGRWLEMAGLDAQSVHGEERIQDADARKTGVESGSKQIQKTRSKRECRWWCEI